MSFLETVLEFTIAAGAALDSADLEAGPYYAERARDFCDAVRDAVARGELRADVARTLRGAAPELAYRFTRALLGA